MCRCKRIRGCAVVILLIAASPALVRAQATENTASTSAASSAVAIVAAAPTCHCDGDESSSTVIMIKAALASPLKSTGIEFIETPLEQVVNQLQEEYGISIQLDGLALQDAGLNPQEPINVNVHNTTLKSALRLMLKLHQLTYIIQNEVLLITTPKEAKTYLVTCVYDVRDLPSGGGDGIQALIDAITSCVATESWAANGGGHAQIRPLKPGVLVVSQTQQVHEDIRDLLAALRQVQ
jgi:hypothetical protein